MDPASQLYRNHVDSKFTWNDTKRNRGTYVTTDTDYVSMKSGVNNAPNHDYNDARSPFNQENEPLWAYNDDGILMRVLHLQKDDLKNGTGFVPDALNRLNLKSVLDNKIIQSSNTAKRRYNYKIIRVEQGTKKSIYKGKKLAELLEIPNHSITVVDTDQVIGTHFKMNQGEVGNLAKRNVNNDADRDYVLYWFINPIVMADSANKASLHDSKGKMFNDWDGITVKALVNFDTVTMECDNNDTKLNFRVRTSAMGTNIMQSRQIWTPKGDQWNEHDFGNKNNNYHSNITVVNNCKKTNNISSTALFAKQLLVGQQNNKHMKPPPIGPGVPGYVPPTSGEINNGRGNAWQKYNRNILALSRKRSGDLFQGWLTKNLLRRTVLRPGNVRIYMHRKDANGNIIFPDLDETNTSSSTYCPQVPLLSQAAPWYTNSVNRFNIPNIFHSTGDYPHLAWCLENGLNVLFKPTKTTNFFYFKRNH